MGLIDTLQRLEDRKAEQMGRQCIVEELVMNYELMF
jgi:hypothetical protein